MQRRYAIALLIGISVGLLAIASQAIDPWQLTFTVRDWRQLNDWRLSDWNGPYLSHNAQYLKLLEQAYLIKACHLLVEQGLTYLIVPAAISCVYVKLQQISRTNEVVKDLLVSLKVSFGFFLFFSSAFTLTALISAFSLPGNWELRFLDVWRTSVFFFTYVFPWVFPTMTVLGFAILIVVEGRLKGFYLQILDSTKPLKAYGARLDCKLRALVQAAFWL